MEIGWPDPPPPTPAPRSVGSLPELLERKPNLGPTSKLTLQRASKHPWEAKATSMIMSGKSTGLGGDTGFRHRSACSCKRFLVLKIRGGGCVWMAQSIKRPRLWLRS